MLEELARLSMLVELARLFMLEELARLAMLMALSWRAMPVALARLAMLAVLSWLAMLVALSWLVLPLADERALRRVDVLVVRDAEVMLDNVVSGIGCHDLPETLPKNAMSDCCLYPGRLVGAPCF